jgi:hypothetical protein
VDALIRAGVPLLTGTDAPAPGATFGESVHGELQLLVHDGMTPMQALAAATSVPARVFRLPIAGDFPFTSTGTAALIAVKYYRSVSARDKIGHLR